MRYQVEIVRTVTQVTGVEVETDNEDEAESLAIAAANDKNLDEWWIAEVEESFASNIKAVA